MSRYLLLWLILTHQITLVNKEREQKIRKTSKEEGSNRKAHLFWIIDEEKCTTTVHII